MNSKAEEQLSAEPNEAEQQPFDTRKPWHAPVLGVIDIAGNTQKVLRSHEGFSLTLKSIGVTVLTSVGPS